MRAHCRSACWGGESECTNLCFWVIDHRSLLGDVLFPDRDKRKAESLVDASRGTDHSNYDVNISTTDDISVQPLQEGNLQLDRR